MVSPSNGNYITTACAWCGTHTRCRFMETLQGSKPCCITVCWRVIKRLPLAQR